MKQFKSEDKGLNKKNNKESGNRRKWICGILAVLLLLVLIWLLHSCRAEPVHEFFDPSARTGTLPGRSEKEIQEELNKVVEEGMFNISIASVVTQAWHYLFRRQGWHLRGRLGEWSCQSV